MRAGAGTLAAHTNPRDLRIFAVINPFRDLFLVGYFRGPRINRVRNLAVAL